MGIDRFGVLHELELSDHDEAELAEIAAKLAEVRRERRKDKDELKYLSIIRGGYQKIPIETLESLSMELLGKMRKYEAGLSERKYRVRLPDEPGMSIRGVAEQVGQEKAEAARSMAEHPQPLTKKQLNAELKKLRKRSRHPFQ